MKTKIGREREGKGKGKREKVRSKNSSGFEIQPLPKFSKTPIPLRQISLEQKPTFQILRSLIPRSHFPPISIKIHLLPIHPTCVSIFQIASLVCLSTCLQKSGLTIVVVALHLSLSLLKLKSSSIQTFKPLIKPCSFDKTHQISHPPT